MAMTKRRGHRIAGSTSSICTEGENEGMTRRAPTSLSQGQDPPEEADRRVLRQFRQIFNAVKSHFRQVEKTVGLGGAQVWALSVIRETPDVGIGDAQVITRGTPPSDPSVGIGDAETFER